MTEYIEPDDVDELVEASAFHYSDRKLLMLARLESSRVRKCCAG